MARLASRPPTITMAKGLCESEPMACESAAGNNPRVATSKVIMIGRRRNTAPSTAASTMCSCVETSMPLRRARSWLMILASSIASTRFRRMREAVVLKTLGATRMRIVSILSVEFSVLGLLAGAVGVVFANLLTRVLLHRLDIGFHIEWGATMLALVGTAVLATATGWIASYRILGLRPLEVLREE